MKNTDMKFCINCHHTVLYSVASNRVELAIRGTTFSYIELSAYCEECGEPIYIPEINDANVTAREEAYREAKRLITIAEIKEILDKYCIAAGPLAKLLGFGEITINRYLIGQLPSRDHSEKLLALKNDRRMMETLLESNRTMITNIAYTKCRNALDKLNELYGTDKINVIARYFLAKSADITPLALQKLLYYAQALYFAIFKENLFEDDCQAWAYGPVFPEIYYRYKGYGYDPVESTLDELHDDFNGLTLRETEFLNAIISTFGSYSGKVLSEMTHHERPWIEARGSLQPMDRSVTVIKRESINKYFEEIKEKYKIVNPCDIQNYSSDMYKTLN